MISSFFAKIGTLIGIVALSIAGYFGVIQEPLGSQLAVGGETYYLSGSGVSATQSTVDLTKFGYTKPDGTYQKFSMTNFGALGCGTIQPGNNKGKQEFVSFTGVTQNSDNTAQLTGISRGLARFSPYTASTTLQTSHAGGSSFVVANSPPCFYENYVTINNAETISSVKTFASTTAPKYDASYTASGNEFTSFNQVNTISIAGGATTTEVATGENIQLATCAEAGSGTASSTSGAPKVLKSACAGNTYKAASSTIVVITGASNTIDANFIATTSAYTWTGQNTFSSSTVTTFLTTNATTTSLAVTGSKLSLNGVSYSIPSASGASSTVLAENGSGGLTWNSISNLGGTKLLLATTTASVINDDTTEQTAFTYSLAGGSLSTGNAIRVKGLIYSWNLDHSVQGVSQNTTIRFKYGATTVVTETFTSVSSTAANALKGYFEFVIMANGATNSQFGNVKINAAQSITTPITNSYLVNTTGVGGSSIDSTAAQTILITGQVSVDDSDNNGFTVDEITVELLKL